MPLPPEIADPRNWSYLVGVLLQLALGAWILLLAPHDLRHRVFAVLVASNAAWDLAEGSMFVTEGAARLAYERLNWHAEIWTVGALAAFLTVYPQVRPWSGRAVLGILVAVMVVDVAFLVRPEIHSTTTIDGQDRAGPLYLVDLGWFPLLSAGALIIMDRARRDPPRDVAPYVVSLALLVYAVWNLPELPGILRDPFVLAGVYGTASDVARLVGLFAAGPVALLAIVMIARHPQGGLRVAAFLFGLLGLLVVNKLWDAFGRLVPGFTAMIYGILVAYALARARLFDIDLKLKWTLSRSVVAGAFVAAFFIASQVAQLYLEGYGPLVGGAAVGFLLFTIHPLQRAADRLADPAMPNVHDTAEYVGARKRDVYRAALEGAMSDGEVTPKERDILTRLQLELGIANADARAMEAEMRRSAA